MSLLFDAVGESLKRAGTIAAKDLDKGVQVTSKKLGAKNREEEPLWLSGKVVKMRKLIKSRGPGFAPHPGQPLKKRV
jgi:hypothetical protein